VDQEDGSWVQLRFQAGCRTLRDIVTDVARPSIVSKLVSKQAIHVTRVEYDAACETLSGSGVPLKADREESWRVFMSVRGQYATFLIALANLVYAPKAPWSLGSNTWYCSSQAHETRTRMRGKHHCLFQCLNYPLLSPKGNGFLIRFGL
jgi:hypothetical protein